ncbi:MAG TPA: hypothetical protein VEU06_07370 [Micropepsaceae bacterium]|nr:hypothetical protein [Micropepsaceae bacterium]
MRTLILGVAASVAVVCVLSAPVSSQYVYGPPPIAFDRAQPLDPTLVRPDGPLNKPPVVTPTGAIVANFLRIEVRDGARQVGIVTLKENKTIAVPLEHLRLDPATRAIVTDLSWRQLVSIPSGPSAG